MRMQRIPVNVADQLQLPSAFPGLSRQGTDGQPVVFADAAGGTHVPESVVAAIGDHFRYRNANPRRPGPASAEAAAMLRAVRERFACFSGGDADGVVFGANATSLTWHFARAFERQLAAGDAIVCTQLDHEANVSPWLTIAERRGARVRWVSLDPETFDVEPRSLEEAVDERTRLIAFTRASNLTGTIVAAEPFVAAARAVGAVTYADAVHLAPHRPLCQGEVGVDAQVCSPYKFFGPHMGVLSMRPELLERLAPDRLRPAPASGPVRWEPGMRSLEAIAGLGATLEYMNAVGYGRIVAHEQTLVRRALDGLARLSHLRLYGRTTAHDRTPTFAVAVDGLPPSDAADRLAASGVLASAGNNYAIESLRALGLDPARGLVRLSFVHYHRPEEMERTLTVLAELRRTTC